MKIFLACVFGLIALSLRAEEPKAREALQTVVENEGKFFELGQEQGTRAAFLAFLADDGIIFRPGPVNGKAVWKKRPEKGISFSGKPLFAAISHSADLAYTTGPAEWKQNKDDAKPFGYGLFVSIWRKQKDGSWKVALDVGSETPGAPKDEEATQLDVSVPDPAATRNSATAQRTLREAEKQFAIAAKADSTIALSEACLPTVRVQREGVFPAVGKDPARLMLSVRRGQLSLEPAGGGMSAAGDLAYTYGKYSLVKTGDDERGYYLQIWQTDTEGAWKIALDYQTPLPSAEKK